MVDLPRRARDLGLVDRLDALPRVRCAADVWRVTKAGRDPTEPSRSRGRWSDGTFDVLYTSRAGETALSEIHALLSLQPVVPSRDEWRLHRLKVSAARVLDLGDFEILKTLGVDIDRYESRDYSRTQPIGEAAFFLGADGLLVPSARAPGVNFVAFMERVGPADVEVVETVAQPVDWGAWRRARRTAAERQPTREGPL